MDKILTQSEIDALLNSLSDGGTQENEKNEAAESDQGYTPYDFRTANKFSKEQIRTLNNIFDNYSYLLSTRLTGTLRTICEAQVLSIEETAFSEFNNSIPSPVVLAIVDASPFRGPVMMEITSSLAYGMIGRMFGGTADYAGTSKNFTEIELAMLQNIVCQMIVMFEECWEKVVKVDARLNRIETSSQFTQIAAMNEPSAIVTLNVKIDDVEDVLAFCIPHFVIQPILKYLSTTKWTLGGSQNEVGGESQTEIISQSLLGSKVTLSAVLNPIDVPMRDILLLKEGDVLCLNHSIDEWITVKLEHIPKFKGVMGVSGQKQVVQIAEVIKEEDLE